ncbi:MAG: hypothetical protein ABSB82_20585 [Terriglobia bacterium]
MSTSPALPPASAHTQPICGKIIETEMKVIVDPTRPLPLAWALYAIETAENVCLCAYYGANRSVFDYLPQKGAEINEKTLGITFAVREFVPKEKYGPSVWEEFKKARAIGAAEK